MKYDLGHKITSVILTTIILTGSISFAVFVFVTDDVSANLADDDTPSVSADAYDVNINTKTISIESPPNQWAPDSAIQIAITDSDANHDNHSDEILDAASSDYDIPTLIIGEPLTLSHSNGTTWIGFYVQAGNPEFERLSISKSDPTINDDTKLNLNNTNDDPLRLRGNYTDDRPDLTGFMQYTVTDFSSARNILTFNDKFDDLTQNSIDALGIVDSGNTFLGAFDILILDLDHTNLKDVLINNDEDGQHGFNMLNYDISSLGSDITLDKIQINVARQKIAVLDTDGPSGYVPIPQEFVTTIYESDIVGQLQIVLFVSGQDVDADTEYPIFLDFFTFGYVDNGDGNAHNDTDDKIVTNQVIRLELEESTDNQGMFEGALDYVAVNRLNIFDKDVYADMSPTSNHPSFIVIEDQISNSALKIKYGDLSASLPDTLVGQFDVASTDRVTTSNLRIVDSSGDVLNTVLTDTQVQITTDISNDQNADQLFAYLVQIQDRDGRTVALSWISGLLPAYQPFVSSASWTPTETGTYTVTAFVWESIDNPKILSSPITIDVSVV